ncbi:leukocyte immunoglobulin-like receptor subfamily A member 2 isoform X3 [Cervus elaphus]|uniref:leukocyte immunoglobulin-like receptor subfamily A member 2 isoform X3 n=1 Tax=Cervus elaphus TaxID=9860 RepID=UPI001CC30B01|nr:leukocyte immunoglobulin-like receptor subfamily A member 2 isoform X3 [Cervus elaphus]
MRGSATTLTFTTLLCLGLCWGPWNQGQPEVLPKPSIWADPGTMVAQGSPVTIWCQGSLLADVYRLYKESGSGSWEAQAPQGSRNKAGFHFEYTRSGDAGQYQCAYRSRNRWSEQSDPLPLVVTGLSRAPSLSAQPGSLVLPGDNLTLRCGSEAGFGSFALTKDERLSPPRRLEGQQSPDFPLGRVTHAHGGRYRCYRGHNVSHAWSAPSAPLDILVAGIHRKPSLSARPGTSVPLGENVTLQCRSEVRSDTFHLSKEGSLAPPQHLHLQDTAPPVQANFTLRAVTSAHGGTYRCYSSQSTAPHLLSLPSDPLELLVSGAADSISPPQNKPDPRSDYTVQNLIRMGLAASVLLLLGVLLCQARHDRKEVRDAARS